MRCKRKAERKNRLQLIAVLPLLFLLCIPVLVRSQGTDSVDQNMILAHLNAVINWYKELAAQASPDEQPRDTIYSTNAGNMSSQVVRLAFQSARAQAALRVPQSAAANEAENKEPPADNGAGGNSQKYAQFEREYSQRVEDDQTKIDGLTSQKKTPKADKQAIDAQIQSLQGKLALDQATLDAVQQMQKFVEESSSGGTGLERNINELARSVPEVFNAQANVKSANGAPAKNAAPSPSSGLIGQLVALYKEMLSIRSIEQRLNQNDDIQKIANNLRAPLRKKLSDTLQQGRDLGNQSGVSKQQYDALTQQFKQLSAALLPLSEEIMVLDQSHSNFLGWRSAHIAGSRGLLIAIVLRLVFILLAIGIIVALADAWRRLTFRYIHDPRRRRQFLVMRRFVMGFFIATVLVLGFVSEFGSLATFAGFVTAGIAVGLQTVLLSVAAYFFVIGRYGIRIGDRITIAGVTGDVVDLGLVRFYVMEYAASGSELFPTGRIVVFSNSVLFQPTTPLYKQLPGTHYTWHEAVVPLASGADREALQKSLNDAVQSVYQEYSRQAEWQNAFNYDMEISVKPPKPEERLQFSDTGAELVVRYPVDLHRAPEIDEKIATALMDALSKNGHSEGIAGTPRIRTAVKV